MSNIVWSIARMFQESYVLPDEADRHKKCYGHLDRRTEATLIKKVSSDCNIEADCVMKQYG